MHEIVLYQVEDTNICVNVFFREDTFWMTQKAMAELFDCTTDNISLHLFLQQKFYSSRE